MEQKYAKPNAGRLLMSLFLFFALFGLTFGLSIIFLNNNKEIVETDQVIPKAEVKLPKNSPTPSPTPSPSVDSQAKVGPGCKVGGCNNEICLDENDEVAASICIYKERFACYQKAECIKQSNEKCDWTQTKELTVCIKEKDETEESGQFCGGIAGTPCPEGYDCKLDGNYPDAGGKCIKG